MASTIIIIILNLDMSTSPGPYTKSSNNVSQWMTCHHHSNSVFWKPFLFFSPIIFLCVWHHHLCYHPDLKLAVILDSSFSSFQVYINIYVCVYVYMKDPPSYTDFHPSSPSTIMLLHISSPLIWIIATHFWGLFQFQALCSLIHITNSFGKSLHTLFSCYSGCQWPTELCLHLYSDPIYLIIPMPPSSFFQYVVSALVKPKVFYNLHLQVSGYKVPFI